MGSTWPLRQLLYRYEDLDYQYFFRGEHKLFPVPVFVCIVVPVFAFRVLIPRPLSISSYAPHPQVRAPCPTPVYGLLTTSGVSVLPLHRLHLDSTTPRRRSASLYRRTEGIPVMSRPNSSGHSAGKCGYELQCARPSGPLSPVYPTKSLYSARHSIVRTQRYDPSWPQRMVRYVRAVVGPCVALDKAHNDSLHGAANRYLRYHNLLANADVKTLRHPYIRRPIIFSFSYEYMNPQSLHPLFLSNVILPTIIPIPPLPFLRRLSQHSAPANLYAGRAFHYCEFPGKGTHSIGTQKDAGLQDLWSFPDNELRRKSQMFVP
ncbi:uncharacterized protein ARMOST_12177 [Armillaria ostoyae]|uniref:Uncharacterized protein n=1 Tax=Armillaria ostoyae TaxID=47428 RepID=A0A284RJC5_ARMOS|nr:uncharacterized protein ARMOST_12177 [Armillaria ostoyae]